MPDESVKLSFSSDIFAKKKHKGLLIPNSSKLIQNVYISLIYAVYR